MADLQRISGTVLNRFSNLELDSVAAIALAARKGLESSIFYDFADSIKMSEKKLARLLNLSARTISKYREEMKSLKAVEGEHLLKLIAIFGKGEEIFGSVDQFNDWLEKPFSDAGDKPIEWLVTPGGVDLITEQLDRIAHSYAV